MTRVLTTFIGRIRRDEGGYPAMTYRFPDGGIREAAFLGYPLARWLDVDHLVILGTPGSMWDHLFEVDVPISGLEEERLALVEAVDEHRVEQNQLDSLAAHLGEALDCGVTLRLIPAALAEGSQLQLLDILAEVTDGADSLSMDVTHGYRHLPMLALTAALYLRSIRQNLTIEGFWYGAVNPETNEAALHNLHGLLEISDWIAAWQRFESADDYSAIAPLLEDEDPDLADLLRNAAFFESIHQGQHARKLLQRVRERLRDQPLTGPGALFQPALLERTEWVTNRRLHQQQREQAFSALSSGDYLRACLYGFEAFVTKLTQQTYGNPDRYDYRQAAKEKFEDRPPRGLWDEYKRLRDLRNVLAHGNQPRLRETRQALHDPQRLREALARSLEALLPREQT